MINTILLLLTDDDDCGILINAADIYAVTETGEGFTKVKFRTYNGLYSEENVFETPVQIYNQLNNLRKMVQV